MDLLQYKFYYVCIHGAILSIGLYKLYNIGLLPLAPADWIDLIPLHSVIIYCNVLVKRIIVSIEFVI